MNKRPVNTQDSSISKNLPLFLFLTLVSYITCAKLHEINAQTWSRRSFSNGRRGLLYTFDITFLTRGILFYLCQVVFVELLARFSNFSKLTSYQVIGTFTKDQWPLISNFQAKEFQQKQRFIFRNIWHLKTCQNV